MKRSKIRLTLEQVITNVNKVIKRELTTRIKAYKSPELIPLLHQAVQVKESSDRALMVQLGCEAVGGNWHDVVPAMVALELYDISLIVIDDFFDKQLRRMQKPTIFAKFGPLHAVIIGIVLKSMSTQILIEEYQLDNSRKEKIAELLGLLEGTHEAIYYGQYQDIRFVELRIENISDEMYLEMIKNTTGVEISTAIQIGGILGDGDVEKIAALKDFGMCTGTIFQIRDDLIDYVDREDLIGKVPFSDIRQKRRRLPLILAYRLSHNKDRKVIDQLMDKSRLSKEDIDFIINVVNNPYVIQRIKEMVGRLQLKAERSLGKLDDLPAKKILGKVLELAIDI